MKKTTTTIALLLIVIVITGVALIVPRDAEPRFKFPRAPRDNSVVDDYHGLRVADPYRPLEQLDAEWTVAWRDAENRVTDEYFASLSFYEDLLEDYKSFGESLDYASVKYKYPDGKYYTPEGTAVKVSDTRDGDAETVCDIKDVFKYEDDDKFYITDLTMSPDGSYLNITYIRNGSDWGEILTYDMTAQEFLNDDVVKWVKWTTPCWAPDSKGFYYHRVDEPAPGEELTALALNARICYHAIGTKQDADAVAFATPEEPFLTNSPAMVANSPYLLVMQEEKGIGNGFKVKDLRDADSQWHDVNNDLDAIMSYVGEIDDMLYFAIADKANNSRVIVTPASNPSKENWTEIIAPDPDGKILASAATIGDKLVVCYMDNCAMSEINIYNADGSEYDVIELPGRGTVSMSRDYDGATIQYVFSSPTVPSGAYIYDFATKESRLVEEANFGDYNPDDYINEEITFEGADGTPLHMFVTRHKDVALDGTAPTLIYGYGGFLHPSIPGASQPLLFWLYKGGIFVTVNARGGNEYGVEGYKSAIKMNKKTTFDDFIAAAEWLVDNNYTSPERLAVKGGSNGGMVVGAVTNMRPDLFAVAIPMVGVQDMMRYQNYTFGWCWATNYGTAEQSREMAEYIYSYSPLHNVRNDGTPYPAIFAVTADHDDRVVPSHTYKYMATLQEGDNGPAPKLLRTHHNAGHGYCYDSTVENAEIFAFIFDNFGIDYSKIGRKNLLNATK